MRRAKQSPDLGRGERAGLRAGGSMRTPCWELRGHGRVYGGTEKRHSDFCSVPKRICGIRLGVYQRKEPRGLCCLQVKGIQKVAAVVLLFNLHEW